MKIIVITPYDSSNYGAYLQAYCLKYQLEKLGHTVFHVSTRDAAYVRNLYYRDKPISKWDKLKPWQFKNKTEFGKQKLELFQTDQEVFRIIDIQETDADVYILGSDEIWNVTQPAFRKSIFWGESLSPVISYAASVGKAEIETFKKYPEQVNALRKMNATLVRDERTKAFVEYYTNMQAEIVCDPTMLVPVNMYGEDFYDSYVEQNDCLLIYAYRLDKKTRDSIRIYARKNKLRTVACCFQHDWCDHQCQCRPLQFSDLIRQCKAVITTTFHGSIFSILNHANFVSIPTSPKTSQLLEQFNLEERLLQEEKVSVDNLSMILDDMSIDYSIVDAKIETLRIHSIDCLQQALAKVCDKKPKFDYQICPSDNCTGCFACMNKCPKQAIHCVVDTQGRTLPQIDPVACIQCGLCKKTCPQVHPVLLEEPKVCYAAQRKDRVLRKKSASGGIGAVLTEYFLSTGGVVYGAAVQQGGMVTHVRADKQEEGEMFRCSKYVQSYIGENYKDVLQQLKAGKKVLFTGTPCQISGLKAFLGKPYENLYCVDIICHGVPPMQYLKEHIDAVTNGRKIDTLSFRGGEKDFCLNLISNGKKIYSAYKDRDVYFYTFLKSLIYRENCYSCQYARSSRCSDITIGDFWKLNRNTLTTDQEGNISAILVNTEQGHHLFQMIQNQLVYEVREIKEAIQGNPQLQHPASKHSKRERFIQAYLKTGNFEKSIQAANLKKEIIIINIKHSRVWRRLGLLKRKLIH